MDTWNNDTGSEGEKYGFLYLVRNLGHVLHRKSKQYIGAMSELSEVLELQATQTHFPIDHTGKLFHVFNNGQ